MSIESIPRNLLTVFRAIDLCIEHELILPALALIYTTMDVAGSLVRQEGEGTRKAFIHWTDSYLLGHLGVDCDSIDLYAARCGLLHTLTAEADLIHRGEARPIVYAWGDADAGKLQETARRMRSEIVIHVSSLRAALAEGIGSFLKAAETDQQLADRIEAAGALWFTNLNKQIVDVYLSVSHDEPVA